MTKPNWANQTIFTGDNLDIMRGLNGDTVDLIYLDPPFCSDEDYAAPIGSEAAGAAFEDYWDLDDVEEEEHGLLAEKEPALYAAIHAAGLTSSSSMKAYLIMMSSRLLEMRRILKPNGSIFLHCDDHAGNYLGMVMDSIFGSKNFKNEIIWKRTSSRSDAKRFGRIHDKIFYYGNGGTTTWNPVYTPLDPGYVKKFYRNDDGDGRGRWQLDQLTASGPSGGESGEPWRGVDPTDRGNHWRTPTKGGMSDYIIEHSLIAGWPDAYPSVHQRLDALDEAGLIHWPKKKGGMPRLKRYLESTKGNAACDLITDIPNLSPKSKEYLGYPTQKPLKLVGRFIAAASNPGDVVLDPFCGCATACVSAYHLGRQWIGIDLSSKAAELVAIRLQDDFPLDRHNIIVRDDIPKRKDIGHVTKNKQDHKPFLYGKQEGNCAGCGTHFEYKNLTVDRIIPENKGGQNNVENVQLLCGYCNSVKGDREMAYLRAKLKERAL